VTGDRANGMRLRALVEGQTGLGKWITRMMRWFTGVEYGPVAIAHYRRPFFGRQMGHCLREQFDRPHFWSRGEMELFAAFVSHHNECVF